jgi:hypothetical protein
MRNIPKVRGVARASIRDKESDMKGRPGNRRGSKGARKSTRSKAGRSKSGRSKSARSKSAKSKSAKSKTARTKRTGARKATKTAARKKTAGRRNTARKSAGGSRRPATAKKATPRKTTARKTARRSPQVAGKEVFGEGNYTASREFRREQTGFVRRNRNRIPELGEKAEQALEGPEGRDLEAAEDNARAHSHSPDEDR